MSDMDEIRFEIAAVTDIGTAKEINQDCIYAAEYGAGTERSAFAVLCDGMGGLSHGEYASREIVRAFMDWADMTLDSLDGGTPPDRRIREEWTAIVGKLNRQIQEYGQRGSFTVGSTVTVLLITRERYYVMNIGDSRAYEIAPQARQLTVDHTVVENEVRLGNLTYEQARSSPMKGVLTRCVGVAPEVYPDMFFGTPRKNDGVYILCSDGFRHTVTPEEMENVLTDRGRGTLESRARYLVELNKARGERDNISVIAISLVSQGH